MNYLIFCLFFWTTVPTHVGHLAEYHYHLNKDHLHLKFLIEKEELMRFKLKNSCDIQKMTALCTAQYLNKHTFIKINGELVEFELERSFTEADHLIIYLKSVASVKTIKEIRIYNNCFYEFDQAFKNRIVVTTRGVRKSFLLNRDRKTIDLR